MTRFVFPELFYAAGAPIAGPQEEGLLALRWILHASLGMPRALFHVWQFSGQLDQKGLEFQQQSQTSLTRLVTWSGGTAVAVQLTISIPSGPAVLRAYSAANGTGHVVDEKSIVGPISNLTVSLIGTPVASIVVSSNVSILSATFIPMDNFINHPGWKLVETVGLPVTSPEFDSSGYPLVDQGPVGGEMDPVKAAIRRVKIGTPTVGWPTATDRGMVAPAFSPPDPEILVVKELNPLVGAMAELLTTIGEPSEHAGQEVSVPTKAPISVGGKAAAPIWQSRARPSRMMPLGTMLLAAGTDPYAALALGFGTTLPIKRQIPTLSRAASNTIGSIYMVTVGHKVTIHKELPFGVELNLDFEGELCALYLGQSSALPPAVAGLTSSARQRLDPPQVEDGRWLEVLQLAWQRPVMTISTSPRTSSYAVARGLPSGPLEVRNEKRLSGGHVPFVAAMDTNPAEPTSVRYSESGVPEMLPGEPSNWVYSVAAQDWFGRWSGWLSVDQSRSSVAPQIPGITKVELLTGTSIAATQTVTAAIEFTWDWSYRTPAFIRLRLLTHAAGTPPPGVGGSVLGVGGPTVADLTLDFTTATLATPPAGIDLISEESLGNLRTYRVEIPNVQLTFGSHPRITVTARAQASERIVSGRFSAWSRDVQTSAASPVPPPPPFVPAEMWWASIPDPRGVARTTLEWAATAPLYAVYMADETALLRELDQPSSDLEIAPAERLVGMRSLPIGTARRAFRRVADRIPVNQLEISLPRGSRLIHFFGIVPISATGVEGQLPTSANAYFAVAAPAVKTPEPPTLIARDRSGTISLSVESPEPRVPVGRVEIYRVPSRHRAVSVEDMGPPIAVLDDTLGIRSDGRVRFQFTDPTPGTAWRSVFYRAIAWGRTTRSDGIYGGRSLASPTIEVTPSSPMEPFVTDLLADELPSQPDHRLVNFVTDVTLARTPLGVHTFAVHIVQLDASIVTRRIAADALPLLGGTLPIPTEQPDTIFRFDPVQPRTGRTYAWVPRDIRAVIVEVMDPVGRSTRVTREFV